MNQLGYDHVKTLRGCLDTSKFHKLSTETKLEIRKKNNLSDEYIVGFVFRNQLRKSVPNLLDGFNLFRNQNPHIKTKLLLHTHWSEGWDIPRLLREKNIPKELILTSYFCNSCGQYEVKPFSKQEIHCKYCGSPNSQITTNVKSGVSEDQLNEIYNIMDVYCHPFTSGGQEIPIQEAKLTELITLVTNYSCGEDSCSNESGGIPLEWNEYREPGTQFIKASTCSKSICEKLTEVFLTHPDKRSKIGQKARQWVIENFSIEVIGKKLEEIFDLMPYATYDHDFKNEDPDPNYKMPQIFENEEFVVDLYKNILKEPIDKNHAACIDLCNHLRNGAAREQIYQHIINQAIQKLTKPNQINFEDLFSPDDEGKRIAVVMPQSGEDILMINSLLENLKSLYPDNNIYIFTDPSLFDFIRDNPAVYKVLPYSPMCDNLLYLEGQGSHKGFFEMAFLPHVTTQKINTYHHNGKDKIQFSLK